MTNAKKMKFREWLCTGSSYSSKSGLKGKYNALFGSGGWWSAADKMCRWEAGRCSTKTGCDDIRFWQTSKGQCLHPDAAVIYDAPVPEASGKALCEWHTNDCVTDNDTPGKCVDVNNDGNGRCEATSTDPTNTKTVPKPSVATNTTRGEADALTWAFVGVGGGVA